MIFRTQGNKNSNKKIPDIDTKFRNEITKRTKRDVEKERQTTEENKQIIERISK